jgi:hypothetical protein
MNDEHTYKKRRGRFLPWLWCAVTVGLLGVVVVTTVPAWLVAVWVASTGLAITRGSRR